MSTPAPRTEIGAFERELERYRSASGALERARGEGRAEGLERLEAARAEARASLDAAFTRLLGAMPGATTEDVRFDPETRLEGYLLYGHGPESWRAHVFLGEAALRAEALPRASGLVAYYDQLAREKRELHEWWRSYDRENPGAISWEEFERRYRETIAAESTAELSRFLATLDVLEKGLGGLEVDIDGKPGPESVRKLRADYGLLLKDLFKDLRNEKLLRATVERVSRTYRTCASPLLREFLRTEMEGLHARLEKAWAYRSPETWGEAQALFLAHEWPGAKAAQAPAAAPDEGAARPLEPTALQISIETFVRGLLPRIRLLSRSGRMPPEALDEFARRRLERYLLLETPGEPPDPWELGGVWELRSPELGLAAPPPWGIGEFEFGFAAYGGVGAGFRGGSGGYASVDFRLPPAEAVRFRRDLGRYASSRRLLGFEGLLRAGRSWRVPPAPGDFLRGFKAARWDSPRLGGLAVRRRRFLRGAFQGIRAGEGGARPPALPAAIRPSDLRLRFGRIWMRGSRLPSLLGITPSPSPRLRFAAAGGLHGRAPGDAERGWGLPGLTGLGASRFRLSLGGHGPGRFPAARPFGRGRFPGIPVHLGRGFTRAGAPRAPTSWGPVGRLFPGAPEYARLAFRPGGLIPSAPVYPDLSGVAFPGRLPATGSLSGGLGRLPSGGAPGTEVSERAGRGAAPGRRGAAGSPEPGVGSGLVSGLGTPARAFVTARGSASGEGASEGGRTRREAPSGEGAGAFGRMGTDPAGTVREGRPAAAPGATLPRIRPGVGGWTGAGGGPTPTALPRRSLFGEERDAGRRTAGPSPRRRGLRRPGPPCAGWPALRFLTGIPSFAPDLRGLGRSVPGVELPAIGGVRTARAPTAPPAGAPPVSAPALPGAAPVRPSGLELVRPASPGAPARVVTPGRSVRPGVSPDSPSGSGATGPRAVPGTPRGPRIVRPDTRGGRGVRWVATYLDLALPRPGPAPPARPVAGGTARPLVLGARPVHGEGARTQEARLQEPPERPTVPAGPERRAVELHLTAGRTQDAPMKAAAGASETGPASPAGRDEEGGPIDLTALSTLADQVYREILHRLRIEGERAGRIS